jgi:DNA-directed RNA polymerase sigma subunit (sigma70/sigma32)
MEAKTMSGNPENTLMSVLFGIYPRGTGDTDFYDEVEGETLRDALFGQIEKITESVRGAPGFTRRIRRVIELRFGFEGGRSRTLEEIGNEFGLSKERVRQIEAKALRILRRPKYAAKLRLFIKEQNHA